MIMRGLAGLAVIASLIAIGGAVHADDAPAPEVLVDALNLLGGKPQNVRVSHEKGICSVGKFTAAEDAKTISKAALFSGAETAAIVRFSIGGPSPKVSDKSKSAVRGMAVSFATPDGPAELVLISSPLFVAKTPADFLAFLQVRAPDPATGKPDPEKIKAFTDAHPESLLASKYLNERPLPASYADATYFGVHTFFFTNADDARKPARWIIKPVDGGATLTDEELKAKPDEFFNDDLKARLPGKPAAFDFSLQFAAEGDSLLDSTAAWPDTREIKRVGRLTVTTIAEGEALERCQTGMFNPLELPDGIEPSDDPILQIRPAAYAVSLSRRNQ
jgi:catalase